jgi:hypothetical protein
LGGEGDLARRVRGGESRSSYELVSWTVQ